MQIEDRSLGIALLVDHRRLEGAGVQDIDCVADVEAFPQTAGARRLRIEMKARGFVPRSERGKGIVWYRRGRWDVGK